MVKDLSSILSSIDWSSIGESFQINNTQPTTEPTNPETPSASTTTTTEPTNPETPSASTTTTTEPTNPETPSASNQEPLNEIMDKILNKEKFSYDLNGDALYQQYKDKYLQQGKMAREDAIGKASTMTGGYGNSYAQSVGQQAYQAQLDNLNDIVPELHQMAYDKYNQEGQDLYNQFSMLGSQEERDYGRYRDSVTDWQTERNYLAGRYDSERDFDYSKYNNERNFAYGQYSDDRNFAYGKYADDRTLAYDQYSDDKTLAYNEHRNAIDDALDMMKFEYQKERDRIADEQWQKQYDAVYGNKTTGGSSGGSSGGSGGGSGGTNYNDGGKDEPKPVVGFTGKTYNDAVAYAKSKGVPSAHAAGIMTASEWNRRKNSGGGGAEVKNCSSYQEYLQYITKYLVEQYN
jgi:hypothetical protein